MKIYQRVPKRYVSLCYEGREHNSDKVQQESICHIELKYMINIMHNSKRN